MAKMMSEERRLSTRKRALPTLYSHEFPSSPRARPRAPSSHPSPPPPAQQGAAQAPSNAKHTADPPLHYPPPAHQGAAQAPSSKKHTVDPHLPNILNIPCLTVASYNPTSMAYYTSNKDKFSRELRSLSNHDILLFQETKLLAKENMAHKGTAPRHTFFYSNNPFNNNIENLTNCTAGVATAIRTSLLSIFDTSVVPLHQDLAGHALVIRLTARGHPLTINVINVRFTADSDKKLEKQEKQAKQLREALRNYQADFTFLGGDLNFIENEFDSTTPDFIAASRTEWDTFVSEHRLWRVPNDVHTFYHLPSDGGAPRSAALDRFYISHSEADLELVAPVASSNTAFFHHRTSSREKDKGRNIHIPVSLRFVPLGTKSKNFIRIDDSILDSELFSPWAEKEYERLCRAQPDAKAITKLDFFKKAIRVTATNIKKARAAKHNRFAPFQRAVTLYRLITTKNPSDFEVLKVTRDFPDLNSLISQTAAGWVTRDLRSFINDTLKAIGEPEKYFGQAGDAIDPPPLDVKVKKVDVIKDIKVTLPSTRIKVRALRTSTDENPSSDPGIIGPVIQNHYKKIWAKCPSDKSKSKMADYLHEYNRKINLESIQQVSLEIILQAIDMAPGTSPGPDGIPFKAYKVLNKIAGPLLLEVFNFLKCARTADQLGDFNFATLFLIPKKDTQLIDDTRPISCNNTCNRIVARAMVLCIVEAVQQLIGDYQKMFLPSRQMTDHIRHLNELFYKAVQGNQEQFILFMDNRKAFDSIHHDFIWAALEKQGFPSWVTSVLKNLMEGAKVDPSLAPGYSINIKRGVKQGCPLSPLIFILVYDILQFKLAKKENLGTIAAADDLAATASSISTICSAFPVIDEYSEISGLGINRDKTEIISAKRLDSSQLVQETIAASAWPLVKLVSKHKYLGIIIGREVQVLEIYEAPLKKATERANL